MKKIKVPEVFQEELVLETDRGELYQYAVTDGEVRVLFKIEPFLKNEDLAVYDMYPKDGDKWQLVMAKQKDGSQRSVPHPRMRFNEYKYHLLGEDFAYAYHERDGWEYSGKDVWTVMSKNAEGNYENMTPKLSGSLVAGNNKIVNVHQFYNIPNTLSLEIDSGLFDQLHRYFEKREGNYFATTREALEAKYLPLKKQEKETIAWQPAAKLNRQDEQKILAVMSKGAQR